MHQYLLYGRGRPQLAEGIGNYRRLDKLRACSYDRRSLVFAFRSHKLRLVDRN